MRQALAFCMAAGVFLGWASNASAESANVVKVGGDVVISEDMTVENAVAIGGDVTVRGAVANDVVAVGGSVILGPNARVGGDVVSLGRTVKRDAGAKVEGGIVEISLPELRTIGKLIPVRGALGLYGASKVLFFLGFLAMALLIVTLFPSQVGSVSSGVESNMWRVILLGILGLVAIVPVAFLLGISLVGIVLIPVEIALVITAFIVGYVAVAQVLGKKIVNALKRPPQSIVLEMLWGVLLLWVIGWVPFLGCLVKSIVLLIGFGAVLSVTARSIKLRF